jgi:N-acetylglucosaminyl-diphospho-decaprenol L-rhamnosyltransferase
MSAQDRSRPDLSIIIVTHNGRTRAIETLRSARASLGNVSAEWLVVDSGSSDGTPDAIERYRPDIRVLRHGNIGFAAANNVALRRSQGRYVLLLNPDVEIRAGTLADLVAELDRRPTVGAASVIQQSADGTLQPSARRFSGPARELAGAFLLHRLPLGRGLREHMDVGAGGALECSVDWVVGAFLAVRREALERVGGLDERFFLYSEEEDWCLRIRAAGWDIRHLPSLRVVHHCGGYGSVDLKVQLTHSKLLFAEKHFEPGRRRLYRAAVCLGHGVRAAALSPAALLRPSLRPKVRGEVAALRNALGLAGPPFERPALEATAAQSRPA